MVNHTAVIDNRFNYFVEVILCSGVFCLTRSVKDPVNYQLLPITHNKSELMLFLI
jgi:hypothetical protein